MIWRRTARQRGVPKRDVHAPETGGRAERSLEGDPVAPDRLDHPGGKGRAFALDDREPRRLFVPLELDAGGFDRRARGVDELGPRPVTGDQRDPVGSHAGILMA